MNVAVITPYYREPRPILERCIRSVREQTVAATHILVADGHPQEWIDDQEGVRHIRLDIPHNDYGNTPRMTGFLLAVGEEFDAIAFLDADHWLASDHVAACATLAESDPELDFIIPSRAFLRPDGTPLPVTSEEIDGGYIDTNCHFILPGAFHAAALWGTMRKPAGRVGNSTVFLFNLQSEQLRAAWVDHPTVYAPRQWESVYTHIGETPPPETEPVSRSPIWLLGDGRSGTTWLFELINWHYRYRSLFEPFNPGVSRQLDSIVLNQYLSPDQKHPELDKHLADIFSGRFHEARWERARSALYYRVLVKDIYANLFAYWAQTRFPELKIVLILRHPFAVATSKLNVSHWFPKSKPVLLLEQENLHKDFLGPYEDLIRRVDREGDFALNQVLNWAIINTMPLRQFAPHQIHVTLYEALMEEPRRELGRIFTFLDPDQPPQPVTFSQHIIDKPSSSTVRHKPDGPQQILPEARPEKWEKTLSQRQIRQGVKILDAFGLSRLYNDSPLPNPTTLKEIQEQSP
ncbi:MAG: sulfotransferase [Spirochaeta sp.]|nr:sulfotransferase [Spirochaeta sp.]